MKRNNLWAVALIAIMLMGMVMPQLRLQSAQAAQDVTAQAEQLKSRVNNYDIRDDESEKAQASKQKHRQKLSPGQKEKKANLGQSMREAKARLAGQVPGLEVKLSNTGSAEIVGVQPGKKNFLTNSSSDNSEKIVRDFVGRNAALYGLSGKQVAELKKVADYTNPAGNLSWVELRQEIKGLPVFQGELRAALTRKGELVRTVGRLAPVVEDGSTASSTQSFSAQALDGAAGAAQAVAQAAATIGVSINANDLVLIESAPDRISYVFERGPFDDDIKVEAVYFPLESGLAIQAWSTVLWQETPAYYTIVDAEGGDLLWRKNITEEQTQSATYSIYDGDNPGPLSPSNATPGSGIQGAGISRSSLTLISEHPSNNLGWITDGGNTTTGNNVDAGLDIVSPNGIDPTGRATGSPFRVFNFAYNPAPLGADAPSGANYRMGAVTNLFFWANRYHDRLYALGFTEAAGNFQQNNFGRGGLTPAGVLGNDFVRAEAQDFSGTNNANFSTGPDGSPGRCQMFIWPNPNPDRDGDLDQEIILHELTHGTSNRLHSNAAGLGAVISRGMGEGWSDFYARSLLSSADEDVDGVYAFGAYATFLAAAGYTNNYYYGIRRFPYAVKSNVGPNGKPHNPLTFADIDPNQIDLTDGAFVRGPFGLGGRAGATAVHNIGEVWCMALLEVRARIIKRLGYEVGNQRMLQLVTDAMKLDPVTPTLLDARNSLLAADSASFNSEDELDIWAGFATRGMGFGSSIVSIRNHNVKESFDYPIPGMGSVAFTDDACNSNGKADAGEDLILTVPLTNPLTTTLTNVTATAVDGGMASYGTIAPGATVTRDISYRVPSSIACGDKVTVSVIVNSSLGQETKTFKIQTGTAVAGYSENFDGVAAPALPAGWTTTATGAQSVWVTSSAASDTAPNSASSSLPATTGVNELISPPIAVTSANSQLSFRHSFNTEFEWDGGVLEVSVPTVNGGAFTEILDAGASFDRGGYIFTLVRSADGNTNALQSRAAWTGNSGGFVTSTLSLPASWAGQNIRLRFRCGSDSAVTVANAHWQIDTLSVNTFQCASVATTTTVAAASVQYSDQVTLSATVGSTCSNPTGSVQFSVNGNPVGSVPVNGVGTVTLPATVTLAPSSYPVAANFVSSNPYYQNSSGSNTLTVTKEDAVVSPSASNPGAVQVSSPGGTAASITLGASIADISDGSPGDISNVSSATFTLLPVGPGSSYTLTVPVTGGGGVGGTVNASATFTNVAVNVYEVSISVNSSHYTGSAGSVLAVFDPSLGFVTGGGTIIRNGVQANFGFNVKYQKNGNAQGSLLYIEHRPTGDVKLKSNSLQTLSIAGNTGIILAKATLNGVGNYSFRATVVDNGEPGTSDQFGLVVTSPNGTGVSDLTFSPVTLNGGNIQVPRSR